MKPGFYVFNPCEGIPRIVHPTRTDAMVEAERLAILNPGKTFQVLAILDQCKKDAVQWDHVEKEQDREQGCWHDTSRAICGPGTNSKGE